MCYVMDFRLAIVVIEVAIEYLLGLSSDRVDKIVSLNASVRWM